MWEEEHCRHQGRGRRGKGGASAAGAGPWGWRCRVTFVAHGGPWWSRHTTTAQRGPHARRGRCMKAERRCSVWTDHGSLLDWETLENPRWKSGSEGLHPGERSHSGEVTEKLYSVRGNLWWSRGNTLRKKWQRLIVRKWLQPSIPVSLHCWRGGGGNIPSKIESEKKGGVEGRCFQNCSYFPLLYSVTLNLEIYKIHLPKVRFTHDINRQIIPVSLSQFLRFIFYIFSPAEEGECKRGLVSTW